MDASLPLVLSDAEVAALHATAKKVRDAEGSYRAKAYQLAAEVYEFGKKHDEAIIISWLNDKGLKVTEKRNPWTAAVKLALAYKTNDDWKVNDSQVGKYAQALAFIDEQAISDVRAWFKTHSIASTLRFSREAFQIENHSADTGEDEGSEGNKAEEPSSEGVISAVDAAVKELESVWGAAAQGASTDENGVVFSIDREKAGIAPEAKFVELIASIDSDNRLTILGVASKKAEQIEADIKASGKVKKAKSAKKVKAPAASQEPKQVLKQLAHVPPAIGASGHFAVIINNEHLRAYFTFDSGDGLLAEHWMTSASTLMPQGAWLLSYQALEALRYVAKYMAKEEWSLSQTEDGRPALCVKPLDNKTTEQWVDAQKAERAKAVDPYILKGKSEFFLPFTAADGTMTHKVAWLYDDAQEGVFRFSFSTDALEHLCDRLEENKKAEGAAVLSINGGALSARLSTETEAQGTTYSIADCSGKPRARVCVHRDDLRRLSNAVDAGDLAIVVSEHGLYATQTLPNEVRKVFVPGLVGTQRDRDAINWVELQALVSAEAPAAATTVHAEAA